VRVLLATSWGTAACGIQSHSEMLIESVHAANQGITMIPSAEALDPNVLGQTPRADILHLNYHRALHSRWTPDQVRRWQQSGPVKVVITFHDTFGELPPDQLSQDLCAVADAFIVHEPCQGLEKAIYWRMGVPVYEGAPFYAGWRQSRPVLGTVGFDFGWKNYDRLAEITAEIGWALTIVAPEMSEARQEQLWEKNPHTEFHLGTEDPMPIAYLRGCDATAFMYTCGNSGQSAAILQGIAARKPVYALRTCRQFRSLYPIVQGDQWQVIHWVDSFENLRERLIGDSLVRLDPRVVRLADQESWTRLGHKHAALYQRLVAQ
jgi:hypothetical protein